VIKKSNFENEKIVSFLFHQRYFDPQFVLMSIDVIMMSLDVFVWVGRFNEFEIQVERRPFPFLYDAKNFIVSFKSIDN